MASRKSIIEAGKGTAGAWRVTLDYDGHDYTDHSLFHYSTLMLQWRHHINAPAAFVGWNELHYAGLGLGSVSDQGGMNLAFQGLRMPYTYRRQGGRARIEGTEEGYEWDVEASYNLPRSA